MMKRILLLLVCVTIVFGISGCGKAVSTDGSGNKSSPLKFSILTVDMGGYIAGSDDIYKDPFVTAFNKKFNVDIEFLTISQSQQIAQQMQVIFASGKIPDIVMMFDNYQRVEMGNSVQSGAYMELDEALSRNKDKLKNYMARVPENVWNEVKYNGKTIGLPAGFLKPAGRRGTYIRMDLLKKYNLEVPKTVDDFINVMRVFKQNGLKYPYSGRQEFGYTDIFFGAYGVTPDMQWNLDKEGNLIPDIINPKMKQALALHTKLREEGLMDNESLVNTMSVWNNKINNGDVGIFGHNAKSLGTWNKDIKANVPDAEWALIPSPIGPEGDRGIFLYPELYTTIYINKNYKEVDRFLALMDTLSTEDADEFFAFGVEGENYTKENGKVKFEYPTEPTEVQRLSFRTGYMFNFVENKAYNKLLLPYLPYGKEMMSWFENIAPNEGVHWYDPGNLASFDKYPDLKPGSCPLFNEYAAKIFYGQVPISDFDKFVDEYLKRGGSELVKEATENYKAGKAFYR